MPENRTHLSKAELDKQLDNALKDTFPASDPVTIDEASATEPDRPLHRLPAELDTDLVKELARNVKAAHAPAPSPTERKRKSGDAEQRALSDAVSDLDSRD